MSKNPIDHGHKTGAGRTIQYPRLARIRAGEAGHPKIRILDRRQKGVTDASIVRHFLRIERGHLA